MKKLLLLLILLPKIVLASSSVDCINMTAHFNYADEGKAVDFDNINWEKSIPVCEKAAKDDPNNFKVLYGLGRSYDKKTVDTDSEEYRELFYSYYKRSYELGFKHAAYVLAMYYIDDENWDEVDYWLDLSMQTGKILAINEKAILLFSSNNNYPRKDFGKAVELLKRVSDSGNAYVNYNLGQLHYFDKYGLVDYKVARKYFEKAANLGSADSNNILGNIYHHGFGVPVDDKKATDYFLLAKKMGETSEFYDQELIQSSMNVWRSSTTKEGFKYYDISINTLRDLAKKGNSQSLTFLQQQRIGLDVENYPLDYFMVKNQGDKFIKVLHENIEAYFNSGSIKNLSMASDALGDYADLMIKNGVYSEAISLLERLNSSDTDLSTDTIKYYLSRIYTNLYIDYRKNSDAEKAMFFALPINNKDIKNSLIFTISDYMNNADNFDSILVSALKKNRVAVLDDHLNRYENALKRGMNDLAQFYIDDSSISINAQRSVDGVSMLHLAVWHGNFDIVKYLVEEGADINLADHEDDTALDYALHKEDYLLIGYLSDEGAY